MKTRLLKALRRKASRKYIVVETNVKQFPFRVVDVDDEDGKYITRHTEVEFAIAQCNIRRNQWILREAHRWFRNRYQRVY